MARARKLSPDVIEELRRERSAMAKGVSLRAWATEMGKLYGVSMHTIYRQTAPEVSGRKKRSDKGTLKAMETEELMSIAALTAQLDIPADLALNTINFNRKEQGLPPVEVSLETVRRHLRQIGASRADLKEDRRVHRRWEAPYPGYLWQMDSTVAHSYYIDTDFSIGYESPVQLGKNKAGNGKPRIWLLCIVDDYSRVCWARYSTGNNAGVWIDALRRAMREGEYGHPDEWPAFGVPQRLYTDQDQAMKAQESVNFLEAFGIERMLALPSTEHFTNAQAKGKVERMQGFILHSFESVTRGCRFPDLDAMNGALRNFLLTANNRVHGTTGEVPFERWLRAPQVVVLPDAEITRRASAKRVECRVSSDLSIRLEKKTYQLPRREPFTDYVKETVPVRYFAADLSTITVILGGEAHEIGAVEAVPDVSGEWKEAPTPARVEMKKLLLEHDVSKLDVHGVFEHIAKQDERRYPIRPPVVDHPLTLAAFAEVAVRRGPAISRLQQLKLVAVPPTTEERAAIDALFAGRPEIPESELNRFIESRREGRDVIPLRASAAE